MDKASGGDGIPVELFQIPNDDVVNVLHSVPLTLHGAAGTHASAAGEHSPGARHPGV